MSSMNMNQRGTKYNSNYLGQLKSWKVVVKYSAVMILWKKQPVNQIIPKLRQRREVKIYVLTYTLVQWTIPRTNERYKGIQIFGT